MDKSMYRVQERQVERLNSQLIIWTVLMAVLYLAVSIWQALRASSGSENFDPTLSVNPRSIMVLCWVAAAIGVAFMPEIGKIFAAVALFAVVALFGYWGYVTSIIKANLSLTEFREAGFGGNWFIGATVFDVVTLLAAVALIVFDVRVIYKNFEMRRRKGNLIGVGAASPSVVAK